MHLSARSGLLQVRPVTAQANDSPLGAPMQNRAARFREGFNLPRGGVCIGLGVRQVLSGPNRLPRQFGLTRMWFHPRRHGCLCARCSEAASFVDLTITGKVDLPEPRRQPQPPWCVNRVKRLYDISNHNMQLIPPNTGQNLLNIQSRGKPGLNRRKNRHQD